MRAPDCVVSMYFLLKIVIIQPAMLVYRRAFGVLVPMFGGGIDPILTVIFFKRVAITN